MKTSIIELVNIEHSWNGIDPLIEKLNFITPKGSSISIIGGSGRGKSTLLNLISGLLKPTKGEVRYKGESVNGPINEIGFVFQNYDQTVFNWLSVRKNILLSNEKISENELEDSLIDLSSKLGMEDLLDEKGGNLSGGEKQRVAIIRCLIQDCDVLLLDEPFSNLDVSSREDLIGIINWVNKDIKKTVVIVSHDIEEALLCTEKTYCLLHPKNDMYESQMIEINRSNSIYSNIINIKDILKKDSTDKSRVVMRL